MTAMQTWTLPNLTLITPMLGGGVSPMEPDLDCPVRPSEIRGQLRYWWRAVQTFETVGELREAEARVWGATDRRSAVTVRVTRVGTPKLGQAPTDLLDPLGYVYFAARPSKDEKEKGIFRSVVSPGLAFDLELRFPEALREDVRTAVGLWALFGGLGARTRRGSGSVRVAQGTEDFPYSSLNELRDWLARLPPAAASRAWPTVKGPAHNFLLAAAAAAGQPVKVWSDWVKRYRDFRQFRRKPCPENPDTRIKQGRSHWPEPDALRTLEGVHLVEKDHTHPPRSDDVFFPRGAYGLPVVFHFKDGPGKDKPSRANRDPATRTLVIDNDHDRWASPVILKVAQLPSGEVVKVCWVLDSPMPSAFALDGKDLARVRPLDEKQSPRAFAGGGRRPFQIGGWRVEDPYAALLQWMEHGRPPEGVSLETRDEDERTPAARPGQPSAADRPRHNGVVEKFEKGWGFLRSDGSGPPKVFVHYSAIEGRGFKTLEVGERVSYHVTQGPRGLQAEAVVRLDAKKGGGAPSVAGRHRP